MTPIAPVPAHLAAVRARANRIINLHNKPPTGLLIAGKGLNIKQLRDGRYHVGLSADVVNKFGQATLAAPPSQTFVLNRSASGTDYDCDGTEYFAPYVFVNPLGVRAKVIIDVHVDDELKVNGVIIQPGEFPFVDAFGNCATSGPTGGPANGEHDAHYETFLNAGDSITVTAGNNYASTASILGTITFEAA